MITSYRLKALGGVQYKQLQEGLEHLNGILRVSRHLYLQSITQRKKRIKPFQLTKYDLVLKMDAVQPPTKKL